MSRPAYIKKTVGGTIFDVLNITFMCILGFIFLFPFWNQLVLSFNEGLDALKGNLYFWPRKFTLQNYAYMFSRANLGKGVFVSLARVFVGTATNLFCSGLLAYVTTVHWFSGRRFMRTIFLITMYFGAGLIPTYLTYLRYGLLNTFTLYWITGLFSAYNMLLIASYMYNISPSLSESARIDGASEIKIYWRIIFPICVPVFAAVAVFSAIGHWNAWFDVIVFNFNGNWDTLQVYLRKILLKADMLQKMQGDQRTMAAYRSLTPDTVRAATMMVVTIPIIMVYPFMQKYFIGGISVGAVKG